MNCLSKARKAAARISFLFVTMGIVFPGLSADSTLYAVYKRQLFLQTNSAMPVPQCSPWIFGALVECTSSNSVKAAAVAAPNGIQRPLPISLEDEFLPQRHVGWHSDNFFRQEELDYAWANGVYTLYIFAAADGAIVPELNLTGDAYPTNAPHITNFVEAQAIDPGADFELNWEPFAGGTTNDLIYVSVRSCSGGAPAFNTGFLDSARGLNGTATSTLLPAGTLAPESDYVAYIRFDKVVERSSSKYPGVTGLASYGSGTQFHIRTGPGGTGK